MKKTSRLLSVIVTVVIAIAAIVAFTQRQQILDAIALYNYTPNDRISSLASETTMRDATRRVFYVNHPQLNDKTQFRQNCPTQDHSIVLGCYVQNRGIYLQDVTEERLYGVVQVTAAHETLHAEYDRLSKQERDKVDAMTSSYFATLNNDRIKKTIEQYRQRDPAIVSNELHSILGTEVRSLSPELESYYSKYFSDRGKIVDFSEKYEQTFVNLTNQVEAFDKQLEVLKQQIDSNEQEIDGQNKDVEQQKARLDALLAADRTQEYNNAVPGFNASVNSYNRLINATRQSIAEYNAIVEKRNNIATTEQQLVEAINSNSIPEEAR